MTQAKGVILSPGMILTIVLALASYGVGGVWWGSSINTQLSSALRENSEYQDSNDAENLRQWSRINTNEDAVAEILSNERAMSAVMARMEEDLRLLRGEMKTTNELLREVLLANARRDAQEEMRP